MEKLDDYLQIMIESLKKKSIILDRLIDMNDRQSACIVNKDYETIDWDTFNIIIAEKETEIEHINLMDDNFQALYDRIAQQINACKEMYADEIRVIQSLIKEIEDKSIKIRAGEERNRATIESILAGKKKEIKQVRTTLKAASNYYKTMQTPFQK